MFLSYNINNILVIESLLHLFTDENAWVVSYHLYMAGTETTATALRWAMLFMCLNPECLVKVQKEIDEQIGKVPGLLEGSTRLLWCLW